MNRLLRKKYMYIALVILAISVICIYFFIQKKTQARQTEYTRQLAAALQKCVSKSQSDEGVPYFLCIKEKISQLMDTLPVPSILLAVRNGFRDDSRVARAYCHDVTHYIGRELARKNANAVDRAVAQCDSTCNNGCYHGALETYLGELSTDSSSFNINHLCAHPFLFHSPAFDIQCFHGVGHGLNAFTRGDIPHALKICDTLLWQQQRESCYYGAIMESLSATIHNNTLRSLDLLKALDICRQLDDVYRSYCYTVLGSAGLGQQGHDTAWAFARCDREAPEPYQDACYTAIGFQIGRLENWNINSSLAVCAQAASHQKKGCYAGLIADFTNNTDVSRFIPTMCRNIEQGYRTTCWLGYVNSLLIRLPLYTF